MKTLLDCSFILLFVIVYCNSTVKGACINFIWCFYNGVNNLNGLNSEDVVLGAVGCRCCTFCSIVFGNTGGLVSLFVILRKEHFEIYTSIVHSIVHG